MSQNGKIGQAWHQRPYPLATVGTAGDEHSSTYVGILCAILQRPSRSTLRYSLLTADILLAVYRN